MVIFDSLPGGRLTRGLCAGAGGAGRIVAPDGAGGGATI